MPRYDNVMRGGRLVRLRSGPGGIADDIYYQIFEYPPKSGKFIAYQYNDAKQVQAAFGEDILQVWFPDGVAGQNTRTQSWWDKHVFAVGAAEEVIGTNQHYMTYLDNLTKEAARDAGVADPSLVGRIANNPEMQQIMVQAAVGDWSPQEVRAAQRNTNFWKNTLYPGIEKFYGKTAEPEKAWAQYVANVEPALTALGYQKDAAGTYNAQVKKMLDKGIDAEVFVSQVPTFVAAKQNAEFAQVLNQWAKRDLGRDVKFNDWFDLLAGESMPELEAVAERARLAYQNQQASAGLTDEQVASLADRTQLSEAETRTLFSEFNQALLALGEPGLQRGGISRDDLLSAFAGVKPASGRSIEEVRLAAAKLARENDLFDEAKISFYVGFDKQGRPNRPGLASLTPEAG